MVGCPANALLHRRGFPARKRNVAHQRDRTIVAPREQTNASSSILKIRRRTETYEVPVLLFFSQPNTILYIKNSPYKSLRIKSYFRAFLRSLLEIPRSLLVFPSNLLRNGEKFRGEIQPLSLISLCPGNKYAALWVRRSSPSRDRRPGLGRSGRH